MATTDSVRLFRWDDMPRERVTDTIDRRLVTAERMMIAHVYLKKGAIVPKHQHENEQITYILEARCASGSRGPGEESWCARARC